jgi:hypothetical protein
VKSFITAFRRLIFAFFGITILRMKQCPHCGRPNPYTRLRCRTCGHSFVKSWQIILVMIVIFVVVLAVVDFIVSKKAPELPTPNKFAPAQQAPPASNRMRGN